MPDPARGLQITYREVDIRDGASPNERFDTTSAGATRVFDVAWGSRGVAAYQLLGYPTLTPGVGTGMSRTLPDFHPDFPWMVATRISSIKGIAARGNTTVGGKKVGLYANARITVEYEMPKFDVRSDSTVNATSEFDRFVVPEIKPSAEYLSIPNLAGPSVFKWSQGPRATKAFSSNAGFIVGCLDYTWSWLQIPLDVDVEAITADITGRVNKDVFQGHAKGSLLLLGAEIERNNSPFGDRTWTIKYHVRKKPQLHNNFYDFISGGWFQISTDGTAYTPGTVPDGKLVFDEREYSDLFNVEY